MQGLQGFRGALIAVVAALAFGMSATGAGASAFYNESSSSQPNPLYLYFSCGVFCENNFSIPLGGASSRPGKSGWFGDNWENDQGNSWTGRPNGACDQGKHEVQSHGWVELHSTGSDYEWAVYDTGGGEASGSPFAFSWGTLKQNSNGRELCE